MLSYVTFAYIILFHRCLSLYIFLSIGIPLDFYRILYMPMPMLLLMMPLPMSMPELLYYIILYFTILHCTILYYIIFYSIILYYIILLYYQILSDMLSCVTLAHIILFYRCLSLYLSPPMYSYVFL